ncbi:hypothetical protein SCCGRSA3_00317 [Marine Group I thaumarchaeote SCGC RSA3]|uniref:Uncharacterized protein n=2 Tax=Marine Group I TaxID=905826 RepID=A0A087RM52_9ARCH|nr:hypothetical protein AAA799D11_01932 [Marine Group I thaumarchaeote SCGC AAA799-D11]KFM19950.1 hypothetical protein SCCGRSA3_00317 [Marine Group I thaumarchaeote SCGC RSA3]
MAKNDKEIFYSIKIDFKIKQQEYHVRDSLKYDLKNIEPGNNREKVVA